MAEFIRDYYNKYGSFLSIDDIQAELRVNCRRTIELWRDGGKMSGPVLIALEGLRKKYKL